MGLDDVHGWRVEEKTVEEADAGGGVGGGPGGDAGADGLDEGVWDGAGADGVEVFFGVEGGLDMGVRRGGQWWGKRGALTGMTPCWWMWARALAREGMEMASAQSQSSMPWVVGSLERLVGGWIEVDIRVDM